MYIYLYCFLLWQMLYIALSSLDIEPKNNQRSWMSSSTIFASVYQRTVFVLNSHPSNPNNCQDVKSWQQIHGNPKYDQAYHCVHSPLPEIMSQVAWHGVQGGASPDQKTRRCGSLQVFDVFWTCYNTGWCWTKTILWLSQLFAASGLFFIHLNEIPLSKSLKIL